MNLTNKEGIFQTKLTKQPCGSFRPIHTRYKWEVIKVNTFVCIGYLFFLAFDPWYPNVGF